MMDAASAQALACACGPRARGQPFRVRPIGSEVSPVRATMSRSVRPGIPMGSEDHTVYVVDDDVRMCEALRELFDLPACLILDVELPDISGLDFQQQLGDAYHPPIVFITGHGDIPSSVRAIKAGAVDFLAKPFSQPDLMAAVDAAITRDRHARLERAERARLQQRYSSLTPRESQVLPLIVSGLLNKQAAAELGISEVTLQIHRSRIMQKMAADSFADLVRMAGQLNIALERRKQQ